MPRPGDDCWSPPRLWRGETAFILGGGPSLRGFDFGRLWNRRCIAVNATGHDARWADCLFFTDHSFFVDNRALIEGWGGFVVTASRAAKAAAPDHMARVDVRRNRIGFVDDGTVRGGRSSGQTATALAVAFGCARVVLLGFDMKASPDGATHHHDRYQRRTEDALLAQFRADWQGWDEQAKRVGCAIVNATPGSALTEFPMVDIDDELGARALDMEAVWPAMF